ncbi:MAG: porin family protein [Rikenellaceae bacterium]
MKKIFTMILALSFVGVQMASAQILKMGLKGGVSTKIYDFQTTTVDGATISPGTNGNIGFQAGVIMKVSIPKFLYIQPELMYSTNDYDYVVTDASYISKVKVRSHRFEVPVMVGFNISALRFFAGPKFVLASSSSETNDYVDLKMDYIDSNIALVAGCGFDIKRFFIDISYTTYLGDSYDIATYNGTSTKLNLKSDSQWNFNVGFFF